MKKEERRKKKENFQILAFTRNVVVDNDFEV